ncbi:MAG: hypothetical protein M3Q44_07740 [bacterium]|nr:hypothetical protein [bacterium]
MTPENLAEGDIESVLAQMAGLLSHEGVSVAEIRSEINTDTWDNAYDSLVQVVNSLLDKTTSEERLFAQSHFVNDGSVIFLTDKLYNYIKSLNLKESWMPRSS